MPDSPAEDPIRDAPSPYRLTGPDLCVIRGGQVHYTQFGLRFYSDLFRKHGKPLPLPGDEATYKAALWDILDAFTADLAAETASALPGMAEGDAALARAWLLRGTPEIVAAASVVEDARSAQDALRSRAPNVQSLELARLRRVTRSRSPG